MEMVASTPNGTGSVPVPFQRRDVEEWSGLNRLTGMLEHARVETDHWATKTQNTVHNYGKVIDSRNQCTPDGNNQQKARRQLEVFQSKVPGGSVQVIRTQTSSSSRWSSGTHNGALGFQDLKLALNPLDISSQKTKANVGRSGSIGGRRPPSRPRSNITVDEDDVSARLERVSRLCQQLRNDTNSPDDHMTSTFLNEPPLDNLNPTSETRTNSTLTSSNFLNNYNSHSTHTSEPLNSLNESKFLTRNSNKYFKTHLSEHPRSNTNNFLSRPTLDELTDSRNYLGSDKSNILPRTLDIKTNFDTCPTDSTTWKSKSYSSNSKADPDTDRRLNTALRSNNLDLEALDQILKTISSSSSSRSEESERDVAESNLKTKRQSFITVESLKEVKGRLRRLSSPGERLDLVEDIDDGIVAEIISNPKVTKVRSYVYGMEAMLHKKPVLGTGSLESRTSCKSNGSSNSNRSEDWYNRRKSYGFEKVNQQQINDNNISLRGKNKIESSTDSGICRSSEIVIPPQVQKPLFVPKGTSTIINLTSDSKTNDRLQEHELFNVWNRRAINDKDSEQITIKIPITESTNSRNINITAPSTDAGFKQMYHRQISEGTSISIEPQPDSKRHSIAVDESKYVHRNSEAPTYRRTSLAIGDSYDVDDMSNLEKKPKRVEFCKTEVHFAAESGRVNIVETDEKPPPTQNFRRRRRTNSSITNNHVPEAFHKTGLPLIHFGDTTYEKKLFGVPNDPVIQEPTETFNKDVNRSNSNEVTISVMKDYGVESVDALESDNPPRGILKNRMAKPKPYILGDAFMSTTNDTTDDDNIWGVRLRPVYKQEEASPQIWRSTVSVQNTAYTQEQEVNVEPVKPEFQKLLHSLRPSRRSESSVSSYEDAKCGPMLDLRRSSWSVADRVKQVEDLKEVKGYSTKVNFGSGEATVIESNDASVATWPRIEDASTKEFQSSKQVSQIYKTSTNSRNENNNSIESSVRASDVKPLLESPSGYKKNLSCSRKEIGTSFQKRNLLNSKPEGNNKPVKKIELPVMGKTVRKIPMSQGVNQSVKQIKSTRIWNKPDLLQHYNNREYVNLSAVIQTNRKIAGNKSKINTLSTKRPDSPTVQRCESPIYENIDEVLSGLHSGLKQESEILEELTRAADQILQAVNGYTDEESIKFSSGEEEDKKHRLNLKMSDDLSTIKETKSLGAVVAKQSKTSFTRSRAKAMSSNSSIESLSRETKPVPPVRMNRAAKLTEDKNRKKITGSNTELSKVTRARRLQRANSREALLQSHGSSSEDITTSVEARKPRLTRKVKTASSVATEEVIGSSKKTSALHETRKSMFATKTTGLQEIRHKTAVSTIKSTAEKAAFRGNKHQYAETRKKILSARDPSSSKGNTVVSHEVGFSRTGLLATTSTQQRRDANAVRIGKGLNLSLRGAKQQGLSKS